jgi:hypothetical protein
VGSGSDGELPLYLDGKVDGFPIHAACWRILLEVHRVTISDKRTLSLDEVEFTMKSRARDLRACNVVNWGDERTYGGAGQYQGEEWTAEQGAEVNYPSCHY